jgi:hypothetical protein
MKMRLAIALSSALNQVISRAQLPQLILHYGIISLHSILQLWYYGTFFVPGSSGMVFKCEDTHKSSDQEIGRSHHQHSHSVIA